MLLIMLLIMTRPPAIGCRYVREERNCRAGKSFKLGEPFQEGAILGQNVFRVLKIFKTNAKVLLCKQVSSAMRFRKFHLSYIRNSLTNIVVAGGF